MVKNRYLPLDQGVYQRLTLIQWEIRYHPYQLGEEPVCHLLTGHGVYAFRSHLSGHMPSSSLAADSVHSVQHPWRNDAHTFRCAPRRRRFDAPNHLIKGGQAIRKRDATPGHEVVRAADGCLRIFPDRLEGPLRFPSLKTLVCPGVLSEQFVNQIRGQPAL